MSISKIIEKAVGFFKRTQVFEIPDNIRESKPQRIQVCKETPWAKSNINYNIESCEKGLHRMSNIGHGEKQCRDCGYHSHECDGKCNTKPKYLRCKNPKELIFPEE